MDRARAYEALGYVVGTLLAFAVGLLGPAVAVNLASSMPPDIVTKGIYGLAAMFIVGTLAGIFGRGLPGLAGLFVGIYSPTSSARPSPSPIPTGSPRWPCRLLAATIGYAIARAIDPLWGSGDSLRRSGRPA